MLDGAIFDGTGTFLYRDTTSAAVQTQDTSLHQQLQQKRGKPCINKMSAT